MCCNPAFLLYLYLSFLFLSRLLGSKDNISAVLVKLPGTKLGPASNGGIDAIREKKAKQREAFNQQA